MADVNISIYTNKVYKQGASTVVPGFIEGEEPTPINPSGSGGASEFVPYVGATENFDLGEFGLSAGFLKLDTTPTNTPTDQGTMYWDEDDNTVDIILNGYIMKVGEDLFYPVKNQTGSSIPKGTNVGFAGTLGSSGRLLITPYLANGANPTSRYMGVTAETIANGADGKVLWFGRIRGINTNAFNEGDILYASTTSAGAFQTTLPVAPNNIVEVAAVINKSTTNGIIFVRPQFLSSGSKWMEVTNGIYRDGRVVIGKTSVGTSYILDVAGATGFTDTSNNLGLLIETRAISNEGGIIKQYTTANNRYATTSFFNSSNVLGASFGYGDTNVNETNLRNVFTLGPRTADGKLVIIRQSGATASMTMFSTGNFLIQDGGTHSDNGFKLDVNGTVRVQNDFTLSDSRNIILGTTTGTRIGTATNQLLSFWNKTPIVQPTTAIANATRVGGGGTNLTDTDTFDGYTLAQVVKALRDAGLLA